MTSTAREPVNGIEMDVSDQGNVSQSASASRRGNKQQVRHRASIACFSCRDRRIRCVVPKGATSCTQCKRSGTRCVIKMDDERRRPISKAYVSSLSARINLLENMLREHGIVVPPAAHPPMTKHEAQSAGHVAEIRIPNIEPRGWSQSDSNSPTRHVLSPPDSHHDFTIQEGPMESSLVSTDATNLEPDTLQKELSPFQTLDNTTKQADTMQQLLYTNDWLSHDRLLGKLRFLGPAANSHVSPDRPDLREPAEQVRRAERIIRSLTPKTHDYLMQNFWQFYNSILQVVDRAAFEADRGSETPKFYSSFLHVIILAVGWRFADQDRCDTARINLGDRESTLHREARHMLDLELERTMSISSVQALLLLGDLECGVGRDNIGRMYAGMANRLAFDIGLHVDCSNIGLPKHEVNIYRRVMKACILQDRYWALSLGRPTSIRSQDIGWDLSRLSSPTTRSFEENQGLPINAQTIDDEIHEHLYELMELASRIVEGRSDTGRIATGHQAASFDADETENNMSQTLNLDRQLQHWYERLPGHLAWNPDNIRTAPCSYFLLHEQYYAVVILLHRSRETHILAANEKLAAKSPPSLDDTMQNTSETEYAFASSREMASQNTAPLPSHDATESARRICTQAAVQIAQAISHYKQKFDLEKICWTNLQPAGTAAMVLLAAIAHSKDDNERRDYQSCLKIVVDAISGMSRLYQPAARMGNLVQLLLAQQQNPEAHEHTRRARATSSFDPSANVPGSKPATGPGPVPVPQYQAPNAFQFPPSRRERRNGHQLPRNGHRRLHSMPMQFATTSEPVPPPPTFHVPPSPSYPQQQQQQQHFTHHQPSASNPFPGAPGPSSNGFYNLDSLWNAGADGSTYGGRPPSSDTYLRVAPSAKGWGLQSLHASQLTQPGPSSFEAEWMTGFNAGAPTAAPPAPPTTTTANFQGGHHHQHHHHQQQLGPNPNLDGKDPWGCKREDGSSGLVWMGGHGQQQGQGPPRHMSEREGEGGVGVGVGVGTRKHELDFLSL
ncbi:fungal-specific transcription factor domain-containing protein [Xylaria sp. CBS 124048]|nr:fungal-specific transcription factor domain-containing protein [Xylaria sp. CBS 124048]